MKPLLYFALGSIITVIVIVIMGYLGIGANTWKDDEDMER